MTCFWDSIYSQLELEDYHHIDASIPANNVELIKLLKSKNKSIDRVTWQKEYLSHNEKKEHITAVKDYEIRSIGNGHLTSSCDSFLLLVCEVFEVSIQHRFLNTNIQYENLKKSRKWLRFKSNRGHFQNDGRASNTFVRRASNRMERIKQQAIQNSQKKQVKQIPNIPRQLNRSQPRPQPVRSAARPAARPALQNRRVVDNNRNRNILGQRPSWRSDPEGFKQWRNNMRNMSLR